MKRLILIFSFLFLFFITACRAPEVANAENAAPIVLGETFQTLGVDFEVEAMAWNSYVLYSIIDMEEESIDHVLYDITLVTVEDETYYVTALWTFHAFEGESIELEITQDEAEHNSTFAAYENQLSEESFVDELEERAAGEPFDYTYDMESGSFSEEEIEEFWE